jgi:hypothetical protein
MGFCGQGRARPSQNGGCHHPTTGSRHPPEGYVVSFVAFHERGLRVPPSHFMRALLHYYKVELHHLAPNSISQAAIFAAVYEGYLGMEPHWNLWPSPSDCEGSCAFLGGASKGNSSGLLMSLSYLTCG